MFSFVSRERHAKFKLILSSQTQNDVISLKPVLQTLALPHTQNALDLNEVNKLLTCP